MARETRFGFPHSLAGRPDYSDFPGIESVNPVKFVGFARRYDNGCELLHVFMIA
jgi:hypothetical protein